MADAVEVVGLEKTFKGGIRALDGVSFAVPSGTVFGLLGPNGAGKTTIVRVLTTVLRADGGSAAVLGYDVARQGSMVRSVIGLAGQNAAVDQNLSARENLVMIGRLNHLPRRLVGRRTDELLGQFELADHADRPLKTYSGGMRRRIDLAAALVAHPQVLFLDEPTTGLDPKSRNDLWAVIEGLARDGTTVLLTTQYLEEADRLASRVAVIDTGRMIAEGTPSELKAELGATVLEIAFADGTVAAEMASVLVGLAGSVASGAPPRVNGSHVELAAGDGPRLAMEALRCIDAAGVVPVGLTLREPSLDDVFLSLTGHKAARSEDLDSSSGAFGPGREGTVVE